MRASRRTLVTILLLVPLAILVGLGVLMVRKFYRGAERDLAPILAAEATRALGHEVTVGKVTLKGGHAYVDDVRVAEGRTLAERGAIAVARQVIVDFDLRTILLTRKLPTPLFGNVMVLDPVARATRDSRGVWNFQDLFKPRPGPTQPSPVGHVTVVNGIIDYSDAALPRNPKRPLTPVNARFYSVGGDLIFNSDKSVNWEVSGTGTAGKFQSTHVLGSYEPNVKRLFLRVQATGFNMPLLARLLPPDVNVTSGLATGRLTLLRSPETVARKTGWPVDIQANVNIASATVVSTRFHEPVQQIGGGATIANDLVTLRLDSGFAGSKLHTEGTVIGFQNPWLNGWATGSGVDLQRALTALNLDARYPALKPLMQLQAKADIRADVRGPLNNLDVRASGPVAITGSLGGGVMLPQAGQVQVAFSGPITAPKVVASGMLPRVRFQGYEARRVFASGVYTPTRAAVEFRGEAVGGKITGRAEIVPDGSRTRYLVVARARGVDLSRIPLRLSGASAAVLRGGSPEKLFGRANADITAQGRLDQRVPSATAEVQALGLRYAGWDADRVRARLRTAGDLVYVEPLVVRDDMGDAIVRGTIDTRTNRLDLRLEAERLDAARFTVLQDSGSEPGKSKNQTPLEGLAYLRDGRITGTIGDPQFAARLTAYGVKADRFGFDFAVVEVSGTRESLTIRDGNIYRFPAVAAISGLVHRPFGRNPTLSLVGDFKDLEMQDLVQLTGSNLDVSGTASGAVQIVGLARSPEISAPQISIADARVGDYDFRSITAGLRFEAQEAGGTWHLDDFVATRLRTNPKLADMTTIRGSASIDGAKRFRLAARATNMDLDLLAPYISDFVAVSGVGEVSADGITGVLQDGRAADLMGKLTAGTRGLTVNGVSLGDLHGLSPDKPATLALNGDTVTSDDIAIGTAASGITLVRRDAGRPALYYNYNQADERLSVSGDLRSIEFEKLRHALAKSPYLAAHPESPAAKYLGPTIAPIEGTLGGSFIVSGTTLNPLTDFSWFSERARIEGQDIQTFEGRIVFDHDTITLSGRNGKTDATLHADETVANAHGSLRLTKGSEQIVADADVNSLPLSLLDRWFPAHPILKDLSGTADSIQIQARGVPSNPSLVLSGLVRDIVWIETQATPIAPAIPASIPKASAAVSSPAATASPPVRASQRTFVTRHDLNGKPIQLETTGREFRVRRLDASTIYINDPANPNKLRAEDIHVTLDEQSSAPTAGAPANRQPPPKPPATGPQPPRTPVNYVIYGAGEMDFDWQNLDALSDPNVDFRVRIPEQGLGLLAALTPTTRHDTPDDLTATSDLAGTIVANVRWRGTLKEPIIRGNVLVNADHIRVARMTTQLKNLKADLVFTDDALRVREFSTQTQVINPKTGAAVRTSDPATPLRITGELPLRNNVAMTPRLQVWPPRITGSSLHVTGANLRLAEAPLPGLASGRLVADDLFTDLNIGGTIFRPVVRGTIGISQADFRAPDNFGLASRPSAAFAAPIFDLSFVVGKNVRIGASQLTATVHTEPGAPVTLRGDVLAKDSINLAGNLIIDKGTLNLPTARFVVQRGGTVALRYPSYDFTGGVASAGSEPALGIVVNLAATTRLTATSINGARKRYTITVDARGPINTSAPLRIGEAGSAGAGLLGERSLQLTFKTDPNDLALSSAGLQQRIVGLLGGQDAIESIFSRSPDVGRLLRTQLTEALSNSFLPELFERLGLGHALGLEEFSIDINELNAFTLRVSRQLFGPLYATYTRRLSGSTASGTAGSLENYGWEFKLSYRFPITLLQTNFQFSYSIDDQRTNAYLLEGVFKF